MIFGVAAMVIFLLAMVITILMTIASKKKPFPGGQKMAVFATATPSASVQTKYKRLKGSWRMPKR